MKNSIQNIKKILLLLNLIWFIGSCDNTVPVEPTDLKGNINGKVFEVDGQTPIEGVKVVAENLDTVYTNSDGEFSYTDIPAASYTFKFSKIAYVSQEERASVVGNKTNSFSVELTAGKLPGVSINSNINEIGMTTAKVSGSITSIGDDIVSNYGHCWSTEENPTLDDFSTYLGSSSATRPISSTLEDLTSGTQYYVRSYATNKYGTSYSSQITFETLPGEPEVSSNIATSTEFNRTEITGTVVRLGVNDITQYGHVWSKTPTPTINDFKTELGSKSTTGTFKSILLNLEMETTYYFRAYAINSAGISYSAEQTFTTTNNFIDKRDGRDYKIVKIGEQIWMAENLNYDTLTSICKNATSGDCTTYGRFYHWDDAQKVAPNGWHLPTEAEWNTLIDELDGESIAGGKMKYTATYPNSSYWQAPNTGATNSSGFSAFGAGYLESNTFLRDENISAIFWSSSPNGTNAKALKLNTEETSAPLNDYAKTYFFSIRCVLDSSK